MSMDATNTPVDNIWNPYEEPFDGLLAPFANEGLDSHPWGLHQTGGTQGVAPIPASNLMDCNTIKDGLNRPSTAMPCDSPNVRQRACTLCSKPFQSQNDLDRHYSSVHEKSTPYYCTEQRCPRSRRGFTRKDNCETHRREVHSKSSVSVDQILMQNANVLSDAEPTREITEEGLGGLSRKKLFELLLNERERCNMEQRKRREVEEELKDLRQRYEEREDMWLKLLARGEGPK